MTKAHQKRQSYHNLVKVIDFGKKMCYDEIKEELL